MNWKCIPCGKLVPIIWLVCPHCKRPKEDVYDGRIHGDAK